MLVQSFHKLLFFSLFFVGFCYNNLQAQQTAYWSTCNDALASEKQNIACTQKAIFQYINEHLKLEDNSIVGTFVIKYTIDENGAIAMVEILKSPAEEANAQVLQLIRSFPNFHPALNEEGKAIMSEYTLPLRIDIQEQTPFEEERNYSLHWGNIYHNEITQEDLNNLLNQLIEVRDIYGNTYAIREIEINVINDLDIITTKAYKTDKASSSMRRKLKKIPVGSTLVLNVMAEKGEAGQRIKLIREYQLISK